MPLRTFIILVALIALPFLVLAISYFVQWELYFYIPTRSLRALPPPFHPGVVFWAIAICVGLLWQFEMYGVYSFTMLAVSLVAGTIIGPVFYEWLPSPGQYLMTVTTIVAAGYGWWIGDYLDD